MLVLIRPLFCYSSFMLMTIIIMIIITYINTFHYTHVHNIQSFLHIKCIVYRALVIKYSNLMEIWNQFYQTFKCIYVWSTSMIIDVILYKKSWIIWIVMSVTKEESSKLVALVVMCLKDVQNEQFWCCFAVLWIFGMCLRYNRIIMNSYINTMMHQ